jgi:hypothetical protein
LAGSVTNDMQTAAAGSCRRHRVGQTASPTSDRRRPSRRQRRWTGQRCPAFAASDSCGAIPTAAGMHARAPAGSRRKGRAPERQALQVTVRHRRSDAIAAAVKMRMTGAQGCPATSPLHRHPGGGNCSKPLPAVVERRLSASKPALSWSMVGSSGRGLERNWRRGRGVPGLAAVFITTPPGDAGRDIRGHWAGMRRLEGSGALLRPGTLPWQQPHAGLADRCRHAAEQEMTERLLASMRLRDSASVSITSLGVPRPGSRRNRARPCWRGDCVGEAFIPRSPWSVRGAATARS